MFCRASAKTIRIVLLTVSLGIGAACDVRSPEVPAEITSRVIYLVPAEWAEIEPGLSPQDLIKLDVMEVGYTSSWDTIVALSQAGGLDALIIHHKAFDAVDQEALGEWVRNEQLLVTGIGIPGLQLAVAIGMPQLFSSNWSDFDDTVHNYYFMYWYREEPGRISQSAASDMIRDEVGVHMMLHTIRGHLESVEVKPVAATPPTALPGPIGLASATVTPTSEIYSAPNDLFTIQLPQGWHMGRIAELSSALDTAVWEVVQEEQHVETHRITIGRHQHFIETGQTLEAWLDAYATGELQKERLGFRAFEIGDVDAISIQEQITGTTTTLYSTYVRCDPRVWFIVTGDETGTDAHLRNAYDELVAGFKVNC